MSESQSMTFICARAASYKVRVGKKRHAFLNGRLVLEGDEAIALKAAIEKPGSPLREWLSVVSLEAAEEIVRQHQADHPMGAIKGGTNAQMLNDLSKPKVVNLQTELAAQGVPDNEIAQASETLGQDGFAQTVPGNINPIPIGEQPDAMSPAAVAEIDASLKAGDVPDGNVPTAQPVANGLDLLGVGT